MDDKQPQTAEELLQRIADARSVLEELIAPLDVTTLALPGPEGWAVKDHLAHLAAWQRMLAAHLRDGTDHDVVGMSPEEYAKATLEDLNSRIYEMHRGDSADAVLREFADANRDLVARVQALTEADLARPYWDDEPGRSTARKIGGDTYFHFDEHREWIGALLKAM